MRPTRITTTFVGATLAVLAFAAPAGAHVSTDPAEVPSGGYATVNFKIGHGCEGSPTTRVEIQVPEGTTSVHAEAIAGWTATLETGTLATPIESEGETITEGVTSVTWTGGPLPDDQYETFGIAFKAPEAKAGTVLLFPTVQTCVNGQTSWITPTVEGEKEPDHPAPQVTLTAATDEHHDGKPADTASDDTKGATPTPISAPEHDDEDDDSETSNVLGIIGIAAGAIGIVIGVVALVTARKRTT